MPRGTRVEAWCLREGQDTIVTRNNYGVRTGIYKVISKVTMLDEGKRQIVRLYVIPAAARTFFQKALDYFPDEKLELL